MRLFRDKSQVTSKCSRNKKLAHEAQPGVAHFWVFFDLLLYCAVLYCTVLCCTVLYCTVLCCVVLYCAVLYCTVLCSTVLCCTVLYCAVLYCTVLYCAVPTETWNLFVLHHKKQIVSIVTSSMGLSSNSSKVRTTKSSCVAQLQNADKQGQNEQGQMYNLVPDCVV